MPRFLFYIILVLVVLACDSQKKVVETKELEKTEILNPDTDLSIAGSVNFEDEESLSIYSGILKNVLGGKPGAYIGFKMDKLAEKLEKEIEYSELLRAGEGLILELNNNSDLYFDSGKTNLNASSKQVLNHVASALKEFPKIDLIIETHTDDSGDEDVNIKMTSERVASIKSYLVQQGIDVSRIKAKAFGESQPRYNNESTENRKKNRRVEFGFYASDDLKDEAQNLTK